MPATDPTQVASIPSPTDGSPRLSVVIASVNGWALLEPTLDALDAQPERPVMQIIVVEAVGGATRQALLDRRPAVEVIAVDARRTIPALRHLGVIQARGDLVAILEDHGEVAPDWAAALIEAHKAPWGAVGGVVENGRSGLVNWAAFFCEYAPYMGPVAEGESTDLPGNNIAYKRPHLLRHAKELEQGRWESWINDNLRRDGVPIASTNKAVVRHIKPFYLGHFLVQRFHFARSYAGMRRVDQSLAKRLVYGIGSIALPVLLLARVTRITLAKGRDLGHFAASIPLIALFYTVGAIGEMIGYLIGPGDSLSRVE
jgi:hypothetical protein